MKGIVGKYLFALFTCALAVGTWHLQLTNRPQEDLVLWLASGLAAFAVADLARWMAKFGWRPNPVANNIHLVVGAICLILIGALLLADGRLGPTGWVLILAAAYPLLLIRRPAP